MRRFLPAFIVLLAALAPASAQDYSVSYDKPYSVTCNNFWLHPVQLPEIGHLVTKPSDGSGNSRWSVGCECLDRDMGDFGEYRKYLSELGVGYARIQSGWAKTERKKGKYDFGWLDEIVDGLHEEGLIPWMCLCYGNHLYSDTGKSLNAALITDGPVMEAWLCYVKAVVKRYRGKVVMYEVWNEPDGNRDNTPENYAVLLMRTAEAIRECDPQAKICGFGMTGAASMKREWIGRTLDVLRDNGKLGLLDVISYHLYYHNPDLTCDDVRELRALVDAYDPRIALFQGESGCPSQLEVGHAMNHHEWTEYSQVKWDLRRMANDFAMDVKGNIFTFIDLRYENMLQSFGLLRMNLLGKFLYKRPSFYGVKHLAGILAPDVHPVQVGIEYSSGRKISSLGIADGDGRVVGVMLWYSDRIPGDSLERTPETVTVHHPLFEGPAVYVEPVTGKVFRLQDTAVLRGATQPSHSTYTGLPLWDCPVLIMDGSKLNYSKD